MGLFANTLFSVLLGWMQTAASWLWNFITNTNVNAGFQWVLENWLLLLAFLCVIGVLVDFLVYLLRWQPYRVWACSRRRTKVRKKPIQRNQESQPYLQRKWVYADGSTEVEDVQVPQLMQEEEPSEKLKTPIRSARRAVRREGPERAYYQPVYPPQWRRESQDKQGGNQ